MTQAKSNRTPPRCLSRPMTAFHSLSPSLSERLGAPNWILVAPDMGLAVKVWDDGTWLWEHSSGATEARGHASDEHTAAQAAETAVINRASRVLNCATCPKVQFADASGRVMAKPIQQARKR